MFICKCILPYIYLSFSCVSQYACLNTGQRCVQDMGPRAEQVWVEKKSTHVLEKSNSISIWCMTVLTILLFIILQSLTEKSNKLERARSKLGNRATWLGIVAAGLKPEKNGSGISSSIPSPMFSASFLLTTAIWCSLCLDSHILRLHSVRRLFFDGGAHSSA